MMYTGKVYRANASGSKTFAEIIAYDTEVFPRNESSLMLRKLAKGGKAAVIGLNSEIDEFLSTVTPEFQRITIFRGKENLWNHNKNWKFSTASYSQPRAELVQLMATGIYQFWKYWLHDSRYIVSRQKFEENANPLAISMSSNVTFVFVILVFGLAIALDRTALETETDAIYL